MEIVIDSKEFARILNINEQLQKQIKELTEANKTILKQQNMLQATLENQIDILNKENVKIAETSISEDKDIREFVSSLVKRLAKVAPKELNRIYKTHAKVSAKINNCVNLLLCK